jgi:hypothetical protein
MSLRPRRSSDANPRAIASRSWRASLIRKRAAQILGYVNAPDRAAAEAAAVKAWSLDADQRSRLVVQERV